MTQSGFVRLVSSQAFGPQALTIRDAIALLESNIAHPAHEFWVDEVGVPRAVETFGSRLTGPKQLPDAYLLGLAIHKKGSLVTLDRGILNLLAETGGTSAHSAPVGRSNIVKFANKQLPSGRTGALPRKTAISGSCQTR